MNGEDVGVVALFLAMIVVGGTDGICDAIKDLRTHLGLHPYGDFWHICKQTTRGSLVVVGALVGDVWEASWFVVLVVGVAGAWGGRMVWDVFYSEPWYWLQIDQVFQVSTGSKWLDKQLGLHW